MAQFIVQIPDETKNNLIDGVIKIGGLQARKDLPSYEQFVHNLAKTMPTMQEEAHHAGTGMAGEGGEILDITKKLWVYGKELDQATIEHLIEELGDSRFYYQALLNLLQITDEEIVASNMIKLRMRYETGFYSDAQALARADKQPAPLSAEGAKGTAKAEPRKFMGAQTAGADAVRQATLSIYAPKEVLRPDAGGPLYAPVDQFGRESGFTPSHSKHVALMECIRLSGPYVVVRVTIGSYLNAIGRVTNWDSHTVQINLLYNHHLAVVGRPFTVPIKDIEYAGLYREVPA